MRAGVEITMSGRFFKYISFTGQRSGDDKHTRWNGIDTLQAKNSPISRGNGHKNGGDGHALMEREVMRGTFGARKL